MINELLTGFERMINELVIKVSQMISPGEMAYVLLVVINWLSNGLYPMKFVSWSGSIRGSNSTSTPLTLNISRSGTLTAHFREIVPRDIINLLSASPFSPPYSFNHSLSLACSSSSRLRSLKALLK